MARARMLAKTISIDKEVNDLSLKAQLIYTWSIAFLDDYGLLTNNFGDIKYLIFPRNSHITEEDIKIAFEEIVKQRLIKSLEDCFYFRGFEKHNNITDYKKAKSQFKENGYNKPSFKESPETPRNPQKPPSEDSLVQFSLVKDKKKERGRFAPPSLAELNDYIKREDYNVDAEQWLDFYKSKDWMIGKNKMKDWQAAVRTWAKRNGIKPKELTEQEKLEKEARELVAKYGQELAYWKFIKERPAEALLKVKHIINL